MRLNRYPGGIFTTKGIEPAESSKRAISDRRRVIRVVMEVRPLPYAVVRNAKALRSEVVQTSLMLRQALFHLDLLCDQSQ